MKYILTLLLLVYYAHFISAQSSLDIKLQSIKTQYQAVGMSVAVIKGDTIAFSKGYGLRDVGRSLPVNDSTVYRIASISKMITASALMILYEQGLFSLDDDVSNHLGFTLRNPTYPNDVITFRKVLSHTSSLRDGTGYDTFLSATYNNNPPPALQSLLVPGGTYYSSNMFDAARSPASSYFYYANINFGVVGTLVERISNQRFDIFCKEKIFQPLGMTGSFNIQDIPNINNVAVLYRKSGSSWVPQTDNYLGVKPPPRNLSGYVIGTNGVIFGPQGGLRIGANDLSKFMMTIMNGGILNGVRILNDTTVERMLNPNWIYNGSNGNNYYGIFNTYAVGNHRTVNILTGETLYGHPGEAYGLISDMYFSKIRDYGIVFITNGGVWGNGNYSGWYNIEEDVYKACYSQLDSLSVGIESIEDFLPSEFMLYQNYPNPFNPTTKIRYTIPSVGTSLMKSLQFVQLKVFDILGNEVTVLVNEEQSPGTYEVEFFASGRQVSSNKYPASGIKSAYGGLASGIGYTSGVYFYQLRVGSQVQTNKMLLLQ